MNDDLTPEEVEVLKAIVKREEAASLVWKWFTSFLYVAIPVIGIYTFWKSLGGQP